MDPSPSSSRRSEKPPRRRISPRLFFTVLLVCVALFTWFYLRGSWAVDSPAYPSQPDEGIKSQIVRSQQGEKEIHTAVVVPVPIETSWEILANYKEWQQLFKTVRERKPTEQLDDNRHHVVSDVATPMGVLRLDFIVTHEKTSDGGYRAWWDAPTDELPVNRGTIRITPTGPSETLLVYVVNKKYRRYPQFVVYNRLLDHQADIVSTLRDRMVEIAAEQ